MKELIKIKNENSFVITVWIIKNDPEDNTKDVPEKISKDNPDDVLVAALKEIVGKESRILQNPAICLEGGENFGLWRYLYVVFYITLDIWEIFLNFRKVFMFQKPYS